jgi:hypothetical protein
MDTYYLIFIYIMKLDDEVIVYDYLKSLDKKRLINIINILANKKIYNKHINKNDLETIASFMINTKNNNFTKNIIKIVDKNYEKRKIDKKMIGGYLQNFGCKIDEWSAPNCI